jgi:hypothetical protein
MSLAHLPAVVAESLLHGLRGPHALGLLASLPRRLRRLHVLDPLDLPLHAAVDVFDFTQLSEVVGESVEDSGDDLDVVSAFHDLFLGFLDLPNVLDFEDTVCPFLSDDFKVYELAETRREDPDVPIDQGGDLLDAFEFVPELREEYMLVKVRMVVDRGGGLLQCSHVARIRLWRLL